MKGFRFKCGKSTTSAGVRPMRVRVFIQRHRETKTVTLEENSKIEDLLRTLRISASEVIPVKNGVIVTEKEPLGEGDEIKLLSVVSGG